MKPNLAISFFITLLLTSCGTSKQTYSQKDVIKVLNSELDRNVFHYKNDKVYLKFESDDVLLNYVEEVQNGEYEFDLKNKIGEEVYNCIFKENKNQYYKEQSNGNKIKNSNLTLPKNVIFVKPNSSSEESSPIQEYSKYYIYLSNPLITKNGMYSIIYYANGMKNGMTGGISIYIKGNDEWKLYRTINEWVE